MFTYLGRGGCLLYMPFIYRETRGCSDNFRYPLIVTRLEAVSFSKGCCNPLLDGSA